MANYGNALTGIACAKFEIVEPAPFINSNRQDPTHGKEPNDAVTEHAEVIVEFADQAPQSACQVELSRQQPKRLYAAHRQGNDN
jgi:hypothetical protein